MKKILLQSVLIGLIAGVLFYCQSEEPGFGANSSVKGRVFRNDTISASTIPVANADVYIGFGFKPQALNYSFKTTTDSLGYFRIEYLRSGEYDVLIVYTQPANGYDILYQKEQRFKTVDESVDVILERSQYVNTLSGQVLTPQGIKNEPLPQQGVNVYIGYKTTPTSTKFLYKMVTDENGFFTSPNTNLADASNYTFLVSFKPPTGPEVSQVVKYDDFNSNNKIIVLDGNGKFKTIKGRILTIDPLTSLEEPRAGAKVFIAFNTQPTSTQFLFSLVTDENGFFVSPLTDFTESAKYNLLAVYNEVGKDILADTATYTEFVADNETLTLTADARFGSIKGIAYFESPLSGELARAAAAEIFLGKEFTPTPSNFTYHVTAANDGSFEFKNIFLKDTSSFVYYVRYNYAVAGKSIVFAFTASHNVINFDQLITRPAQLPGIVSLQVLAENSDSGQTFPTPQPNVDVCLFANRSVFKSATSCTGSIFSGKTDSDGHILIPDLVNGGKYYVRGSLNFGTGELVLKDSIKIAGSYPQELQVFFK